MSPRLVRYYEQQQLLAPTRQANGYRAYDEEHVARVTRIAGLVQAGLPTRLVKEVLELEDAAADERPSCPRTVADMLARELTGIEERIACLSRSRDTIRDYLAPHRARRPRVRARGRVGMSRVPPSSASGQRDPLIALTEHERRGRTCAIQPESRSALRHPPRSRL